MASCSRSHDDAKQYASLSDSVHYVGIKTCAGCHRDIYVTFIRTGMGQSFDIASKEKSAAEFSPHALITDDSGRFAYHPFWSGDSLYLREFRMSGKDTVYSRTERIQYIVGSGQHTNSHMISSNGYVYQAPATFYTQKKMWDLPPGFEHGHNSRFGRKIELECMSCHNAYPQMAEGSENKYTYVANGIDCERCHGPGSKHVAEKQKGNIVDVSKEVDYTIVNPAKLPIDLQLDVCQRCHIQGNAVVAEGKSFFDFRPGMHLSQVMNVFMPVYKGQENEHIMASHVERLKMSRCFIESLEKSKSRPGSLRPYEDAMTCVTCHNPHVSVKVTATEHFTTVCRSCHPSTHEKEPQILAAGTCTGCHMPKNTTIDIPHVSVTDHYIRKPMPAKEALKIREFIGLACINNKEVDMVTKGKAYLSYYEKFDHKRAWLDSAKKYLSDHTDEDVQKNLRSLVRWAFLKEDYQSVLLYAERSFHRDALVKSYSNEDAWMAYRIGESWSRTGDKLKAEDYFKTAVDLAPFIPEFREKLGAAQVENGNVAAAKVNFEFLVKENPEFVSGYIDLGFITLSAYRDAAGADSLYSKALALDPDNEQALINKAGTQVYLNKPEEARRLLMRVLTVNPANDRAKQLLRSL